MDATVALGTGAITEGSGLLDGLIWTLYYADSVTTDPPNQAAVAQTQPDQDGFDGKVTFHGTITSPTNGTITDLKLELGGVEDISITGLSLDFQTMKTAIETAEPQGDDPHIQPLLDVFQDINWTIDASAAQKHVLAYGTGGDDNFILTKFNDLLMLDGGFDTVDMGAGNDTVIYGNSFGYHSSRRAAIDGGAGKDTLAFYFGGNDLHPEIEIGTSGGVFIDLQNGIVHAKVGFIPEATFTSFENAIGTGYADSLMGSSVGNRLDGREGEDEITGLGGKDILTGGGYGDDFNFLLPSDSPFGKGRDVITDFEHKLDDIDLSKLHPNTDTDKFTFIGQNELKHVGDLHFVLHDEKGTAHDFTMVEANLTGDAKPEIQIELTGLVHLGKGDFIL
jgi:Ca2+-binding RTX toxin-like protein